MIKKKCSKICVNGFDLYWELSVWCTICLYFVSKQAIHLFTVCKCSILVLIADSVLCYLKNVAYCVNHLNFDLLPNKNVLSTIREREREMSFQQFGLQYHLLLFWIMCVNIFKLLRDMRCSKVPLIHFFLGEER